MKKITSLILAMAMVFSLSAQVFALNDDMQDNENSEANMIVITTSKEERDKQFNDAMAKVMEQLEGPTLTRDNKERFKYEHFDYQYKTLKGYAGNQLSGGYISLSKYDLISCAKEWRANKKSFQSALDYIYLSKDIIIKQDVLIS